MDWKDHLTRWLTAEEWLPVGAADFPSYLIAEAAEALPENMDEIAEYADNGFRVMREFYDAISEVLDCDEWGHLSSPDAIRVIAAAARWKRSESE